MQELHITHLITLGRLESACLFSQGIDERERVFIRALCDAGLDYEAVAYTAKLQRQDIQVFSSYFDFKEVHVCVM